MGHEQSRPPPIDTAVDLATPNGGLSLTSMCTCNNIHDNVRANAVHSYNCEGDRAGLVCSLRVCACTYARLLSDSTCVSLPNSIQSFIGASTPANKTADSATASSQSLQHECPCTTRNHASINPAPKPHPASEVRDGVPAWPTQQGQFLSPLSEALPVGMHRLLLVLLMLEERR